jgi:polyphosphate kinase 2 (PPK2 family)
MDHYRVQPNTPITLAQWDPNDKRGFEEDKKKGEVRTAKLNAQLEGLQELLYAENKHKVLIVLQAMDTGGKDGVAPIQNIIQMPSTHRAPRSRKIPVANFAHWPARRRVRGDDKES